MKKQIVALGGGGFSMEPENPLLDRFVLGLAGKPRPRVCFVATASADSPDYIGRFYAAAKEWNCEATHLPLFNPPTADLRGFVLGQDVIYVGGGNTKNLLALWRAWELDVIFREAWERGIVLAGISAGSLCWFEGGTTDSIPGTLTPIRCLGYLPGSNSPHYDGEAERRPAYHRMIREGHLPDGLAADDGVALHFIDRRFEEAVSSRPTARAYRVEKTGADVKETPIETRYLG